MLPVQPALALGMRHVDRPVSSTVKLTMRPNGLRML